MALGELVDTYGRIYQLAFRYLRNKEDAEEVTQDVLYKVIRKVGAFRGDAALSSWIYRITFNTAMSRLRTAKHQPLPVGRNGDARRARGRSTREPADWSEMADEQVFRPQLRRRVLRAILALPAIYRAPVMLRDMQGMSTEEASAHAAREGSDAQVAAAPGPADPPAPARGFRRRPGTAPAAS